MACKYKGGRVGVGGGGGGGPDLLKLKYEITNLYVHGCGMRWRQIQQREQETIAASDKTGACHAKIGPGKICSGQKLVRANLVTKKWSGCQKWPGILTCRKKFLAF